MSTNGNGWGGKRNGAGAKPGNQHALKHGSLVVHAPKMLMLAQRWLYGKNKRDQQWAFKEILPYVFNKQPQQVQGNFNHVVSFTRLMVEEVNSVHEGQEN